MANYSLGRKPIPDVEDGHTFEGDNFCQLVPHTKILVGKKGLTFKNCNLINCDIPPDSVKIFSNNAQVFFCSNLHPEWVDLGLIPCDESCLHVVDIDTVTIDGKDIGATYHYQDTLV